MTEGVSHKQMINPLLWIAKLLKVMDTHCNRSKSSFVSDSEYRAVTVKGWSATPVKAKRNPKGHGYFLTYLQAVFQQKALQSYRTPVCSVVL